MRTDSEDKPSAKKLRKIQNFDDKSASQRSMEMDVDVASVHSEHGMKFVPKPPPPKTERFTSPVGRKHASGHKTLAVPSEVKSNYFCKYSVVNLGLFYVKKCGFR